MLIAIVYPVCDFRGFHPAFAGTPLPENHILRKRFIGSGILFKPIPQNPGGNANLASSERASHTKNETFISQLRLFKRNRICHPGVEQND
ncbi:MAG: hypothetical protein WBP63_01480 [Silvibacterium sp.]